MKDPRFLLSLVIAIAYVTLAGVGCKDAATMTTLQNALLMAMTFYFHSTIGDGK